MIERLNQHLEGLARMLHQYPGCWRRTGAAGRRSGGKGIAVAMT